MIGLGMLVPLPCPDTQLTWKYKAMNVRADSSSCSTVRLGLASTPGLKPYGARSVAARRLSRPGQTLVQPVIDLFVGLGQVRGDDADRRWRGASQGRLLLQEIQGNRP